MSSQPTPPVPEEELPELERWWLETNQISKHTCAKCSTTTVCPWHRMRLVILSDRTRPVAGEAEPCICPTCLAKRKLDEEVKRAYPPAQPQDSGDEPRPYSEVKASTDDVDRIAVYVNGLSPHNLWKARAAIQAYAREQVERELTALKGEPGEIVKVTSKQDTFGLGMRYVYDKIDARLAALTQKEEE